MQIVDVSAAATDITTGVFAVPGSRQAGDLLLVLGSDEVSAHDVGWTTLSYDTAIFGANHALSAKVSDGTETSYHNRPGVSGATIAVVRDWGTSLSDVVASANHVVGADPITVPGVAKGGRAIIALRSGTFGPGVGWKYQGGGPISADWTMYDTDARSDYVSIGAFGIRSDAPSPIPDQHVVTDPGGQAFWGALVAFGGDGGLAMLV